jgi:hypothetical protein
VDINEKEIPRHSRIICYTILDYIYCKWFEKNKDSINILIKKGKIVEKINVI